jgi:hypothetical protein
MKFTPTILAALSVGSTFAAHLRGAQNKGNGRRTAVKHTNALQKGNVNGPLVSGTGQTNPESSNWSGGIAEGNGFDYVRGTFVVPTIQTAPDVDPSDQSAAIWGGFVPTLVPTRCNRGLTRCTSRD